MAKITFKVWNSAGQLDDATSVVLCDKTSAYGLKRNDTGAVVVAANTPMARTSVGVYELEWVVPTNGVSYTGWVKVDYKDRIVYYEVIHNAPPTLNVQATSARARRVHAMIQRKGILASVRTYPTKLFDPTTNTTVLGEPVDYSLKIVPPYNYEGTYGKSTLITSGSGMTMIPAYMLEFNVEEGLEITVIGKKWVIEGMQPISDENGILSYLLNIVSNS